MVIAVGLSACAQSNSPPCFDLPLSGLAKTTPAIQLLPGFPGVAYSTQLFSPLVQDCHGNERKITDVSGRVEDELGTSIDARFTLLPRDKLTEIVQLDFVPPHEGTYTIQLAIRPTGERVSTVVNVVNDHRDAGVVELSVPKDCIEARLLGDVLICTWNDSAPIFALSTVYDGGVVSTVQIARFAVAGDLVWTLAYDGQTVSEYKVGSTGVLAPLLNATTTQTYGAVFAAGTEVLLTAGLTADVFTTSDGGLGLLETIPNGLGTDPLVQFAPHAGAVLAAPAGTASLCLEPFPNGTPLPCRGDFANSLGVDSTGVWYTTTNAIGFAGYSDQADELLTGKRTWPVAAIPYPSRYGPILPGGPGILVPRFSSGAVHLDMFPGSINAIGSDDNCIYEVLPGKVRCWRR